MAEPLRTWSHYGKRRNRRLPATFSKEMFPGRRDEPLLGPQLDGTCAYNCASGSGHDMAPDPGEITRLLQQWRTGDLQVEDRLFELLTPEMHQIAERCFRRERSPAIPSSQLCW